MNMLLMFLSVFTLTSKANEINEIIWKHNTSEEITLCYNIPYNIILRCDTSESYENVFYESTFINYCSDNKTILINSRGMHSFEIYSFSDGKNPMLKSSDKTAQLIVNTKVCSQSLFTLFLGTTSLCNFNILVFMLLVYKTQIKKI